MNWLKGKLNSFRFGTTVAYQNEMMLLGENLLTSKMLLWDSETYPFVPQNWVDYGFKVFSQNNEDGLLQYIIRHTDIPQKVFVEFGVESYMEANTRFLLMHNNWSGLIMDGSAEYMNGVRKQEIYWKRTLTAKGIFITKENINELIASSGIEGEIGLLSVDIDGNDYWVFDAIKCIEPRIIIFEYNPIFGKKEAVSIPYKADFYRTKEHYSNLYWGASLSAFVSIAKGKGYKLVCVNDIGNNAFFVKRDASDLPEVSVEDAWQEPLFRESRSPAGELTFLNMKQGRNLLAEMSVVDVLNGKIKKISDLVL